MKNTLSKKKKRMSQKETFAYLFKRFCLYATGRFGQTCHFTSAFTGA